MTYLVKLIKDYARQLHSNNLSNIKNKQFDKKIRKNWTKKVNQRENTVCLKHRIYASPENFTPMLLVMLETFRRSVQSVSESYFVKISSKHCPSQTVRAKDLTF